MNGSQSAVSGRKQQAKVTWRVPFKLTLHNSAPVIMPALAVDVEELLLPPCCQEAEPASARPHRSMGLSPSQIASLS